MPYRWQPLSPWDLGFDRFGGFHDDRWAMRDTMLRGGGDERLMPVLCPTCGRPKEAQELCAACGDPEEMAA